MSGLEVLCWWWSGLASAFTLWAVAMDHAGISAVMAAIAVGVAALAAWPLRGTHRWEWRQESLPVEVAPGEQEVKEEPAGSKTRGTESGDAERKRGYELASLLVAIVGSLPEAHRDWKQKPGISQADYAFEAMEKAYPDEVENTMRRVREGTVYLGEQPPPS